MRTWLILAALFMPNSSVTAFAQETKLGAEWRLEREHLKQDCASFQIKSLGGCALDLFTQHPFHIAVGSLAPNNGIASGLAFVEHSNRGIWRNSFSLDGVASTNGSWRAGFYAKFVPVPNRKMSFGAKAPEDSSDSNQAHTVFSAYAQTTSLRRVSYFGLGPTSSQSNETSFGQTETIVGGSVLHPLSGPLNLSLFGEANGRFFDISPSLNASVPSIEILNFEATAPGLTHQPGFLQFGEGVRIQPSLSKQFKINYSALLQQYLAPADSQFSFARFTFDFENELLLYGRSVNGERATNVPNECSVSSGSYDCPRITPPNYSRDRTGSIGVRFLLSTTATPSGNQVPFYLQRTLGGSDINGVSDLPAFRDYRFRGPNLFLIRESFEHSLYGPIGLTFSADQGKVALHASDIDFSDLRYSYSAGFTVRAGGLPEVFLVFAWGGDRNHLIGSINTSLLGGSTRPSLY